MEITGQSNKVCCLLTQTAGSLLSIDNGGEDRLEQRVRHLLIQMVGRCTINDGGS